MELWDLYDQNRVKLGRTMVRGTQQPAGTYRLVVHACVFNSRGQMLIQQRQPFKEGWPNMWDLTMGGSAVAGDTSQTAAHRELQEELGLDVDFSHTRPAITVNFPGGFDDYYIVQKEVELGALKLQYEEVQAAKWADFTEILQMIDDGSFIPYSKGFIRFLFDLRTEEGAMVKRDK